MMRRLTAVVLLTCFVLSSIAVFAQQPAQQPVPQGSPQPAQQPMPSVAAVPPANCQMAPPDPNDPVEKIRDEGMNRSQVMQTLSYLTDVIGPRLTGSPGMRRANEWTRDTLTKWGLQNAHLEPWGPFGRGWELKRFSAEVIAPQSIPLIAYPKAWSPGTAGELVADVVYVNAKDEAELQAYKGKLKGAIVLTSPTREVKARFEAPATRRDEKDLLALADAPEPKPGAGRRFNQTQRAALQFLSNKYKFFQEEGAAVLVDPSRIGDGGTVFVQQATVPQAVPEQIGANTRGISAYDKSAPKLTPQLVMSIEHYNRIARMIEAGEKVRMAVNMAVQWHDADMMAYNTVAEIPGTDLKDEVVMLGGHMDSWHSGTGATDNGAGVAVGMEAVRILQALGVKPRRTIRIALWSGEEQGLLGSRAYVAQHFGKMETSPTSANAMGGAGNGSGNGTAAATTSVLVKMAEYDKLSSYFNLDNGTGKIRGVYLQGNESVRPLFRKWLAPFCDLGASTLSISNTTGTDHLAFDGIGLPGFQFIQDEIEYDTRTHHSNQDVYDRIQGDDMKQAATIMAAFVYNAAMMDGKLPRKPAPASAR